LLIPIPFCSPFVPSLLTWNPPCCDRIRPPRTQVARKLTSHFPPLSHIPPIPKSRPPGVPRSKYTFIRTTSRTWLTRSSTVSVHSCHWIVSSVTLSVFQLYLENLTYFWNVSSVTWNAFIVIWNASSVNTIHVPMKRRIRLCLVQYAEEL
jgi:hypothetical protein